MNIKIVYYTGYSYKWNFYVWANHEGVGTPVAAGYSSVEQAQSEADRLNVGDGYIDNGVRT